MYKLIDANGKEYESEEKGQLGGHKRLKIYGSIHLLHLENKAMYSS